MSKFTPQVPNAMESIGPHDVTSASYAIGRYRSGMPSLTEGEVKRLYGLVVVWMADNHYRPHTPAAPVDYGAALQSITALIARDSSDRAALHAFIRSRLLRGR